MDDQFDFGSYAPSMVTNSRSGSMKKLARKTDKSPAPNDDKKSVKINNDFDQLDDLLNGDIKGKKKDTSLNKNSSTSQTKKGGDTLDSFFDQPSTNLNLTSKIIDKKQPAKNNVSMDLARTSINFKPQKKDSFDIIDQDHGFANFSKGTGRQRSKSPSTNQIKIPDESFTLQSHTSMRNMRPPLKRKQSQTGLGLGDKSFNNDTKFGGGGLSLLEQKKQPQTIKGSQMLSLSLQDQSQIKPPKNLSRRGSVDGRSQKSQKKFNTGLTLLGEEQKKQGISHFSIPDRNQTSALRIDSPKAVKGRSQISEMKIGQSVMINEKFSNFYNKSQNVSIFKQQPQQSKQSFQQPLEVKNSSSYSFQKPHSKLVEPPRLNISTIQQEKPQFSFNDYEKQLQHIKQAYQKQMTYLQQSLDKQLKTNQQTRDRLIKQSNNMIDQQRKRWTRIHEEQISRLKQMNEWQKSKMQASFKFQIQNLKSTISRYEQSASSTKEKTNRFQQSQNSFKYKRQIQNLNEQLQHQRKLLFDKQNFLTKRQLQLQEKQQQFNNRKRKEQEHFRQQQKLLMEKQNKLRNNLLNQKKVIMDDKQKIAMDAAGMELDIIKRKQKLDMLIKEAQMEKKAVQNQRHEVRSLNQQMMNRYKEKMNQLAQDKERVSNLQADLIRKLRIIQLKAKQSNVPLNQTTQHINTKQNNWVRQRPHSTADQKDPKQQKLNQTFQRYNKIEKIATSNKVSNITYNQKSNKTMIGEQANQSTFKLQDYLVSMNKNKKSRNNNFM